MMYGDPQNQHQQPGGEFLRGPPPQPPMMRQLSSSSATLNPAEYYHNSSASGPPLPPYDGKAQIVHLWYLKLIRAVNGEFIYFVWFPNLGL